MPRNKLNRLLRHFRKARRLGNNASCQVCGSEDIRTLQRFRNLLLCAECRLEKMGSSIFENHHVAGIKHDDFTIRLPANDHAILSDAQYDRPREIRMNNDKSFLMKIAAWLFGILEICAFLYENLPKWARKLIRLHQYLGHKLGSDWEDDFAR